MKGKYFKSFDGAKIHYQKTLKGDKWLIFLHGFGGDLNAWEVERAIFHKLNYSTIAIDLRGHGLSDRSSEKSFYKLENFSKDILALIKKEKLKKFVVVGHCLGGMAAIYLYAKYLKTASQGLVLVDTSFKPPFFSYTPLEKTLFKDFFNLLTKYVPDVRVKEPRNVEEFIGTEDIDIKRIASDMLHTSLRSYLIICEDLVDLNANNLLDKIKVPTLVVEGEKDTIFPPYIAEYLHKRIKKSELEIIPNANHILVINNPEDLEKSIEGFLKRINFT